MNTPRRPYLLPFEAYGPEPTPPPRGYRCRPPSPTGRPPKKERTTLPHRPTA